MIQGVAVILIREDNAVLAQHRDDISGIVDPNTWAAPGGGKKQSDKSLKLAAVRELHEETGYIIEPSDLTLLMKDIHTYKTGGKVARTIFWAQYDNKQEIHCYEGQEMRFLNEMDLKELTFSPGHKNFLNIAIQLSQHGIN